VNPNLERAQLLFDRGQFARAESELENALAEDPEDSAVHALLALCLVKRRALGEAGQHAATAVELSPDSAYAHFVLSAVLAANVQGGEVLFWSIVPQGRNQQPPVALQAIQEAIRLDATNADYFAHKASVHFLYWQWEQTVTAAERA